MSNDIHQNGVQADDEPEPESRQNEPIGENNEQIDDQNWFWSQTRTISGFYPSL